AAEVADPVNPAAMALVRQQLEVFETRQFAWQGVAWPGQSIAWEATEEASQKHEKPEGPSEQSAAAWKTCLRLTLTNLGQITANLRLDARGVEIRFAAVDPETAAVLRGGATPLASGLESAGIKLLGMGVDLDQEA
ncbi:MAG: flagellar hook-length control protein FliK, partial [Nitrosospira sp.]